MGALNPSNFTAGTKGEVLEQAYHFLIDWEKCESKPYWPEGSSGVTWGVGWDAGQHTLADLKRDWSGIPADDLKKLESVTGTGSAFRGSNAKALLAKVKDVRVPAALAKSAFRRSLDPHYRETARAFPGLEAMPAPVQVALISLVFNRGHGMGKETGTRDRRYEMRRIRDAVRVKDLKAIHDELLAMKRIWEGTKVSKGMNNRRDAEAKLVEPYLGAPTIDRGVSRGTLV